MIFFFTNNEMYIILTKKSYLWSSACPQYYFFYLVQFRDRGLIHSYNTFFIFVWDYYFQVLNYYKLKMVSWGKLVTQPFIRLETKGNSNDMVANCFNLFKFTSFTLWNKFLYNSFVLVCLFKVLTDKFKIFIYRYFELYNDKWDTW